MSRMRQRISQRLKDSQNTYAMLTTFNEVDMRCMLFFTYSQCPVNAHSCSLITKGAFVCD